MGMCEFSHYGVQAIIANFRCDKCENKVISEEISLPSPNMDAEKPSDSHGDNFSVAECEKCGKHFYVTVYAGWGDAWVDVEDADDDTITLETIDDEDYKDYMLMMDERIESIKASTKFIDQFNNEISKLRKLNNVVLDDDELQEALQRQIYSNSITCLEDFLSTTLIEKTLNNEEYFKNFVKSNEVFKKYIFDLTQIYSKLEQLNDIIKKELLNVIYHNLHIVRKMYKGTFKIDFPRIEELMEIIGKRHDLVHRNGKNKNGDKIKISKEVVDDVIDKVEEFAINIHENIIFKKADDFYNGQIKK
ncbi:MAG: hypothetical protein N4A71_08125 [Carboxylicivirga sp.]|jgi:hypothetical protein|nr:hypothetical protein [Carboxylicivirga sp.]